MLILIVFCIFVTGVIFAWFFAWQSKPIPTPAAIPGPTLYPKLTATPTGDTLTLDGVAGPVTIRNFYKTAVEIITPDVVVVAHAPSYTIEYFSRDHSFGIVLLQKPLAAARQEAETAMREALAISRQTACLLRVSLGVPYSVEPAVAGTNFGLSFCGNGLPLPSGL